RPRRRPGSGAGLVSVGPREDDLLRQAGLAVAVEDAEAASQQFYSMSAPASARRPSCCAWSRFAHTSPGAPSTGPLNQLGQRPVRFRWALAHFRMTASVSG